jgi:hypothetical protein
MPKERLCRLSISQPKVKSIFGASSWQPRCNGGADQRFCVGERGSVWERASSQSRWLSLLPAGRGNRGGGLSCAAPRAALHYGSV